MDLIHAFDADLDQLKTSFDQQKVAVVIAKTMPRTAESFWYVAMHAVWR